MADLYVEAVHAVWLSNHIEESTLWVQDAAILAILEDGLDVLVDATTDDLTNSTLHRS